RMARGYGRVTVESRSRSCASCSAFLGSSRIAWTTFPRTGAPTLLPTSHQSSRTKLSTRTGAPRLKPCHLPFSPPSKSIRDEGGGGSKVGGGVGGCELDGVDLLGSCRARRRTGLNVGFESQDFSVE